MQHSLTGMLTKVCNTMITKGMGSRAFVVIYALSSVPTWIISMFMGWEPFNTMQFFGSV
jgi:hypothetical protein